MKINFNKDVFSELKTHISLQTKRQFNLKNLIIQIALGFVPLLYTYLVIILPSPNFQEFRYGGSPVTAMFLFDYLFPVTIIFSFTIAFVIGQGKYLSSMIKEDFEQKTFFILFTYDADKRLIFLSRLIVNILFYLCYTILSLGLLLFVVGISLTNGLEVIMILFPVFLIEILSIALFFYFFMSVLLLINCFLDSKITLMISLILTFVFIGMLPIIRYFIYVDNQNINALSFFDPVANVISLFVYLITKFNLINISPSSDINLFLEVYGVKFSHLYPNLEQIPSKYFIFSLWNFLLIVVIIPTIIIVLVLYFSKKINMEVQI